MNTIIFGSVDALLFQLYSVTSIQSGGVVDLNLGYIHAINKRFGNRDIEMGGRNSNQIGNSDIQIKAY